MAEAEAEALAVIGSNFLHWARRPPLDAPSITSCSAPHPPLRQSPFLSPRTAATFRPAPPHHHPRQQQQASLFLHRSGGPSATGSETRRLPLAGLPSLHHRSRPGTGGCHKAAAPPPPPTVAGMVAARPSRCPRPAPGTCSWGSPWAHRSCAGPPPPPGPPLPPAATAAARQMALRRQRRPRFPLGSAAAVAGMHPRHLQHWQLGLRMRRSPLAGESSSHPAPQRAWHPLLFAFVGFGA